jgi:methionyl-tRNA formyltransferase
VLEALPKGCINVHGSLLPKYRGAAPVQWAVINNETETGVAIMQLDEGMDTGPVILERRVEIDAEETSGELLARLAPLGAAALLEAIAAIAAGNVTPVAQDHACASHAAMLDKKDGAIDFMQSAAKVASRIRGVDPWPGAQATLRNQIVKLFRARVTEGRPSGPPGTVLAIDGNGLHVIAGDGGVVVIREIQAPGRKRLTAQQFAAGRGVAIGDVLSKPEVA